VVKPGPKPTPSSLKLFKGETRPSRLNKREPEPKCGPPLPPSKMSTEARRAWRVIVAELPAGLLTKVDWQVMAVACENWSLWRKAMADVWERGILIEGDRGKVKNPALQIARDAAQSMRQCWSELGLTPSARARLEMPDVGGGEDVGARYLS
jgi:P27 family predicted phage terminase small subunit